ncbi:hypothetical protein [Dietzia sp. PP-33]|jgi:hypothetical protein|uniref:hypothetical protein n=1 Tax=Dietzia sp. PP-33 TaxID=2957500 RepID=UPI0029BF4136|nr:hypothetical protein [Dietzia sp. PP-33]MDX2355831.1 hypothetical protein [Dietzia sp. PP-33]
MSRVRELTSVIAAGVSGVLVANAVPHTVKGMTGQKFPTPFADPPGVGLSPPIHNVAWGVINLAAGGALSRVHSGSSKDSVAAVAGGVGMAFLLAHYFGGLNLYGERAER